MPKLRSISQAQRKSFLKLEDIPVGATIRDFNEELYKKGFEL